MLKYSALHIHIHQGLVDDTMIEAPHLIGMCRIFFPLANLNKESPIYNFSDSSDLFLSSLARFSFGKVLFIKH